MGGRPSRLPALWHCGPRVLPATGRRPQPLDSDRFAIRASGVEMRRVPAPVFGAHRNCLRRHAQRYWRVAGRHRRSRHRPVDNGGRTRAATWHQRANSPAHGAPTRRGRTRPFRVLTVRSPVVRISCDDPRADRDSMAACSPPAARITRLGPARQPMTSVSTSG